MVHFCWKVFKTHRISEGLSICSQKNQVSLLLYQHFWYKQEGTKGYCMVALNMPEMGKSIRRAAYYVLYRGRCNKANTQ